MRWIRRSAAVFSAALAIALMFAENGPGLATNIAWIFDEGGYHRAANWVTIHGNTAIGPYIIPGLAILFIAAVLLFIWPAICAFWRKIMKVQVPVGSADERRYKDIVVKLASEYAKANPTHTEAPWTWINEQLKQRGYSFTAGPLPQQSVAQMEIGHMENSDASRNTFINLPGVTGMRIGSMKDSTANENISITKKS